MSPGSGLANVTERIAAIQSLFSAPPIRSSGAPSSSAFGDVLGQVGSPTEWSAASGAPSTADDLGTLIGRLSMQLADGGPAAAAPGATTTAATPRQATGDDIVQLALRHLGTPYVWGAESPEDGFDCSGLVQYVYRQAGIEVPRVSRDQAMAGTAVPNLAAAQPGDLVAFNDPVDHIGIYAGNGRMVVAPRTGDVVKVQEIRSTPTAIRRVLGAIPPTLSAPGLGDMAPSGAAPMSAAVPGSVPGAAAATATPAAGPVTATPTPAGLMAGNGQAVLAFVPTMIPLATATGGLLTPAPAASASTPAAGPVAPATAAASPAPTAPTAPTASSGTPMPSLGLDTSEAEVAASPYGALFREAGTRHGVSPALLEAVAQAESGFDPTAISPVGARGLMQIMPARPASSVWIRWIRRRPSTVRRGSCGAIWSDTGRWSSRSPPTTPGPVPWTASAASRPTGRRRATSGRSWPTCA